MVVVGAGSAGLAAGRRLAAGGARVLTLEADVRIGGRAWTVAGPQATAIDLGCEWLHSAEHNAWAALAEPMGFHLDRSTATWAKPALEVNFPARLQAAYHRAFESFEAKLQACAAEPDDRPAADLIGPEEARWRPLLNAFSGYYNGAPFDQISVKDYAAFEATDQNWRLREGYGALIAAYGAPVEVRLSSPVRRIDHSGPTLRVQGGFGQVEARAVVICVSSQVLADGGVEFHPPLPRKLEAAGALPLGHVEKVFLRLETPEALPADRQVYGRIDTPRTGSYTLRPLGAPLIEAFFGGDLAADLEAAGPAALRQYALDELTAVFGSDLRKALTPVAQSAWRAAPFIRGAYSYARVGEHGARARLAEPVDGRLFFAGEACSQRAFSTAHGAFETGVAAAEATLRALNRPRAGR